MSDFFTRVAVERPTGQRGALFSTLPTTPLFTAAFIQSPGLHLVDRRSGRDVTYQRVQHPEWPIFQTLPGVPLFQGAYDQPVTPRGPGPARPDRPLALDAVRTPDWPVFRTLPTVPLFQPAYDQRRTPLTPVPPRLDRPVSFDPVRVPDWPIFAGLPTTPIFQGALAQARTPGLVPSAPILAPMSTYARHVLDWWASLPTTPTFTGAVAQHHRRDLALPAPPTTPEIWTGTAWVTSILAPPLTAAEQAPIWGQNRAPPAGPAPRHLHPQRSMSGRVQRGSTRSWRRHRRSRSLNRRRFGRRPESLMRQPRRSCPSIFHARSAPAP